MLCRRAVLRLAAAALSSPFAFGCSTPTETDPDTFEGETVRIVVAFGPGGTYDLHARLVANYLGRHLPGHPTVVVENRPGAGGAVAASYLANVARPDGLTIGHLVDVDAADAVQSGLLHRLVLLGSPAPSLPIILFSRRSGITTLDEWRRAVVPPRIGSSGPGAQSFVVPRIAEAALGLPMQIVRGYAGSAEMRLAIENGEVDGICLSSDAVKTVFGSSSAVKVVLRFSSLPIPEFDVPDAMSLASDARARELLQTGIYGMTALARYYAAPPRTPSGRVASLRQGLMRTWSDPEFLAAATLAGLVIAPVPAETLEQTVRSLAARPEILAELRSILGGP